MIASLLVATVRLLAGATARWRGCEPATTQRIYFANHSSHMDFMVLWASLPPILRRATRPVAAEDYWSKGPVRRHLANRVFRAVLIPRSRITRDNNPVERICAALDDGASLILFPEGTRGSGEKISPFKPGLHHLAMARPDVELIPVFIENMNRILPKGEWLPIPVLGGVHFGAPLQRSPSESRADFLARAREAVEALHGQDP
ncbi:MAG: lysophospholipid acyltransferase family protein [Planctomycetota bacterium]